LLGTGGAGNEQYSGGSGSPGMLSLGDAGGTGNFHLARHTVPIRSPSSPRSRLGHRPGLRVALLQRDPVDLGHLGFSQNPGGGTSIGPHLRRRSRSGDHRRHLGQTGQPRHRQVEQRVPTPKG
jgi:hypothetical protein